VIFTQAMDNIPDIVVVIPVCNEAGNILTLIALLNRHMQVTGSSYYLLFVNDGSTDNTLEILKKASSEDQRVKYLSFSRNFGHQAALRAGLEKAESRAVIIMDGDLQHPPELVNEMLGLWRDGYDVVNTTRLSSGDENIFKKVTSILFYKVFSFLSSSQMTAGSADFRLIDRKVVETIRNLHEYNFFFRGLIPWIGFRQTTISYIPNKRNAGKSSYTLVKMIKLASAGITSFSNKPLHIATLIGIVFSIISLLYGVYAVTIRLLMGKELSGWTSIIMSVLFIGGIQLLILGIFGEYLGKIYDEVKKRPRYIIEDENIK
jgi:glycosyltransferase involved in cell wall biosynthesis